MVLLPLEESPTKHPYFLASRPVNWSSSVRSAPEVVVPLPRTASIFSKSMYISTNTFFLLTFKLQKFSKWPPRNFRHAPTCLVAFERNGAILPSALQMHSDCLLNLCKRDTFTISESKDERTDGQTNVPANRIPQEHHATEILINKGITKMFCFSKSGPWNSFLRYTPTMLGSGQLIRSRCPTRLNR